MSFEKSILLFEEVIKNINNLPDTSDTYKIAKQTAKEIIKELLIHTKIYKTNKGDEPLITLMISCRENIEQNGLVYKLSNITNETLKLIYICFKQQNFSNPAALHYIKDLKGESIVIDLNILEKYPLIFMKDINYLIENSDLIAHELTHLCDILIRKIILKDQFVPKTKDDFVNYHNSKDEFYPWVFQFVYYIEERVEDGRITNDQFDELLTKKDSDSFFDFCFDILPQKKFLIHINYLTDENKQLYFEAVKKLLIDNKNFVESKEDDLIFKKQKENLRELLSHNLHLVLPKSDMDFSKLTPMSDIIPESCIGMTKDELKQWLKINRPEHYARWFQK